MPAFNLKAARAEGYSDAEIAEYLAGNRGFDLDGARREGYSDAEIADYLGARAATSLGAPYSDPGRRARPQAPARAPAPVPVEEGQQYMHATPMLPGFPGIVQAAASAPPPPPPPSWGEVMSNWPEQAKASTAQVIAGMNAQDIVASARLMAPPEDEALRAEWMSRLENAQGPADLAFLYSDTPKLTPDRVERLGTELRTWQAAQDELNAAQLPNRTLLQRGATSAVESAPLALAALGAGMATGGNPYVAAGSMFPLIRGQEFPRVLSDALGTEMAPLEFAGTPITPEMKLAALERAGRRGLLHSNVRGASGSLTELLPFSRLLKQGAGFTERLLGDIIMDVPGELVDELVGSIDAAILEKPEGRATLEDVKRGALEGLSHFPEVTVATLIGGAGQAGVASAPTVLQNAIAEARQARMLRDVKAGADEKSTFWQTAEDQLDAQAGGERGAQNFDLRQPTPDDLARILAPITRQRPEEPYIDPATFDPMTVPSDPLAPELPLPDPNVQPELPLATMPAPPSSGSRTLEPGGAVGPTAKRPPAQGAAPPPPVPARPEQAAAPAPPAPQEPAPTPAPQAAPAVSTAQEPPAGAAASPIVRAPDTRIAASVPAAVKALKDPAQHTQIQTAGGPVRLVNVRDENPDTGQGVVHAFDDKGNVVGSMYYSIKPGEQPHVTVVPERQRQGIASAMYDLAEKSGAHIPPTSAGAPAAEQGRLPEGQAFREAREAKKAAPTPATPPPKPGFVRMYHGGVNAPDTGGGRWVTPGKDRAKHYRDGATLYYIDIPKGDPRLKKSFDDEGTDYEAPPVDFELSEDDAKQLRPYIEPTSEAPAPKTAKAKKSTRSAPQQGTMFGETGEPTPEATQAVQPAPKPLNPDEVYPQASEDMPVRETVPREREDEGDGATGLTRLETTPDKFQEVVNELPALFEAPEHRVIAVYSPKTHKGPWLTKKEAARRIESWREHAQNQADTGENEGRVILSLFDLTGNWARPYADAGYDVRVFDLQNGADIRDFSAEWFAENMPEIHTVYGILIACPCTDFTVSGAQWWAEKDRDGRTEASKELVFQALRTVEFWRPQFWALENPAGRIERLTGLPPARLSFQPNAYGDPYTKFTQLWGKFNADLPVAPVKPTEGSKMHSKYGGSSQRTKNARSETPEGFAAAFFMANNYMDSPAVQRLTGEFPEAAGAIEKALDAGFTEEQIREVVTEPYENYEPQEARDAVRQLVKTGTPEGTASEVTELDDDVDTKAAAPKKVKVKPKKKKAAAVEGMIEPEAVEEASGTEGSSRTGRRDEKLTLPSTTRENLMNALGIDPTEFRLKGGKEQWEIVSKAIKDKYGYAKIAKHPRQNWRNAVDHLLDAFESLQNLAAAMGQGERVVSLGGKVSLLMREKPGRIGGYYRHIGGLTGEPNYNIAVFNQRDVYSHELAHAIDYDLMDRVGVLEDGGITRMMRNRENTAALPGNLTEAMADLLNSIYYDAGEMALGIKKVEHQLQKSKSEKRRAELEKRLANMKSAAWRGRGGKTKFYKNAQNGPMKEYLTKPTELLARTFEAYVSWKVQSQKALGLVKFIGKTDALYTDTADEWIQRIYPQLEDRMNIFSRWDAFLGQLAREDLYNTKANPPGYADSQVNMGLMDPVAQAKATGTPLTPDIIQAKNLTQAAAKDFLDNEARSRDTLRRNWNQFINDLKDDLPAGARNMNAAMREWLSTPDGIFTYLERRFPHITSLKTIRNNLSDAQIHGRKKPVGVYRETQRQENSNVNRVEDRLAAVGITRNMPREWTSRMWDIIHGETQPADRAEKRQADQVRYEFDYWWKLRDQTGERIGYIDDRYMNRVFQWHVADSAKFHADLKKLREAEKAELILKLTAELAKAKTTEEEATLKAALKRTEAIDTNAATRGQVAAMKGMQWGAPIYVGALSEDSAKQRVFGPLADKILKDWYIQDPFWLLSQYASAAARGMVMRRRFGDNPDAVFQGWLNDAALDLPSVYAPLLVNAMQVSLGFRRDQHTASARAVNAYANVNNAVMLGRSVLPNISEVFNVLSKSGDPLRTLGTLFKSMAPIIAAQSQKDRFAVADRFGRLSGTLVDVASSTTAMAQAIGEDVAGNGLMARFSMKAFYFNLLSGLTALQEKVVNRLAFEAFYEAARVIRSNGEDANIFRQWLREHGITDPVAFSEFLQGHDTVDSLRFEDLLDGPGLALANALEHYGKTAIQKPTPSTKLLQAHSGLIGIVYRLTSWMTTNFTNWAVVLKDKMVSAATGRYGDEVLTMKQRVQAMAIAAAFAAGVTYLAQATFVVARLLLTNQDEWESRGEDFWDRFFSSKTQWQIAQYWGVFGYMINTAIDIAHGTRHHRGILGTVVGPAYGSLVQDAERFMKLFTNNSPGTNTAEHNAVQAGYHIASMLMTLGLVSVLPTTSTPARTLGFMWSFFGTAPFAPRLAGDIFVGEKSSDLKKRADAGDIGAKIELRTREREAELKKRLEKKP